MHCLLLVGYDDSGYYFNDSLQCKNMRYDKSKVISAYNALNCQAVVIAPKSASDEPPSSTKPETTTSPATTKPQNTTDPSAATKPDTTDSHGTTSATTAAEKIPRLP